MKTVRAWVTTFGGNEAEWQYKQNIDLIDTIIPKNGGQMQGDGSWATWGSGLTTSFAQELKTLAHAAGQRYVPGVNSGHSDNYGEYTTLMDTPANWDTSINNLITLATTGRADSPWDGIEFDSVQSTAAYNAKEESYLQVLAPAVRAAGLSFEMTCGGSVVTEPQLDKSLIASLADIVDCCTYFGDWPPAFLNPYWYCIDSIEESLASGISEDDLYLGLPLFSVRWPVTGVSTTVNMCYDAVTQLSPDTEQNIQWIERAGGQFVKEKYVTYGTGHVYIADETTLRARLILADNYNLAGVMLFSLDCATQRVWQAIKRWKRGLPQGIQRAQKIHGSGGLFSRG